MNAVENRGNFYIQPIDFPNAEEYICDIYNILQANTGFIYAWESNLFFEEASHLIVNAIKLFQLGYFDCAFYSLRQSIETSIGTIFLTENPSKKDDWESLQRGFESGTMSKKLKEQETAFKDMVEKMPDFFDTIRTSQIAANKYVHKQGASSFYSVRNNPFIMERKHIKEDQLSHDFEKFLKVCIGAVAIYRLSLDALPVVLMNEDMLLRSGDFITAPYSEEFVNKYIGQDNIEAFKSTKIYKDFCASLGKNERQNDAVFRLIHWNFFDRKKIDDYSAQLHLCSFSDRIAMCLFVISEKISQVFVDGIHWYFSDIKSDNKHTEVTLGTSFYQELFAKSNTDFNLPFHNVFLSRCHINEDYTYFEHNNFLSEKEISCVDIAATKLTEAAKNLKINIKSIVDEIKKGKEQE